MTTYKITSSAGVELGTYEADSVAGALDAMARDAGYASQADAVAQGVEPFTGIVEQTMDAASE